MYDIFYQSPVGTLRISEEDGAIVRITRTEENPQEGKTEATPLLKETCRQLGQYFEGERKEFSLPLAPEGTEFQKKAWRTLRTIPYGNTISYNQEAALMGSRGARAVGNANGRNPIMIVIPCHRVIRKDGSMGGYTGGLDIKEYLLALEHRGR